jgi:hypothetical protein
MIKPGSTPFRNAFEGLYAKLENALSEIWKDDSGLMAYTRSIEVIRNYIGEMQAARQKHVTNRDTEIEFFRRVWPKFYGRLFLNIRQHAFETARLSLPADLHLPYLAREERKVGAFFRKHREFSLYYRSGSSVLDEQFTRHYSQSRVFDPLSLVLDPEGGTVASYLAAWCLAYGEYLVWLGKEKERILHPGQAKSTNTWEWKESKTAAVELIQAQAEKGSFYINGKKATATQLKMKFEEDHNIDLKDYDLLLYAADSRKMEDTPYLTKLIEAFKGRKNRLGK